MSSTDREIELSVVMPCLNEADTLETCVSKALRAFESAGIVGEVIVADNGSTDDSREIARRLGARVVDVTRKGYGNALQGGIEAARGRYVLMGDADDSYDFLEIPKFIVKLREGFDLVQGCRLPSGGGTVMPGAMPFLHRWWGNPMFSFMVRTMFRAPIHDVYCGMRGFTRRLYDRLEMRSPGMEFATEMIIKSSVRGENIAEVPITLHVDGRQSHAPHLRTFRDGWRTLRFFLMSSPKWLFTIPGFAAMATGILFAGLALGRVTIGQARFDAHTLLFASLAIILGFQAMTFGIFARKYGIDEGLLFASPGPGRMLRWLTLERGLLLGGIVFLSGTVVLGAAVLSWLAVDFGDLDYSSTMRLVIPGFTLAALGFQVILSSFLVTVLGIDVHPNEHG
jgi:glycosyltransferase involved in cell wall biosynthesis